MSRTLIANAAAVLMDEAGTVLPRAFVTVEGGLIAAVSETMPEGFDGAIIDGTGQVVMPGLVNCHTHIPMTLMRGYGGGHDLHDWLQNFIFPVEAKLDDRAIRAGTGLALAELIAGGVTCIADMYSLCDGICDEIAKAGLSANIARGIVAFEESFDFETNPGCVETRELVEKWHGYDGGRIAIDVSLHAEYTSKPPVYEAAARYAHAHGLGMHVHVSETRHEHEESLARHGLTPAAVMERFGVWNTRAIAAHCVWCDDADFEIFAKYGVTAVHNPVSNLKLGSGVARLDAMRAAGVNVALGTDGVSSNNTHDMFGEMKIAALLQKGVHHDPMRTPAYEVLKMATANGAAALGRKAGRIAAGYMADLILVDFNRPNLLPCHDVIEHLVYAAHSADVTMNMARGNIIYKDGTYFTLELGKVRREVLEYAVPKLFG